MIDVVLCASGRDEVRIAHDLARSGDRDVRVARRCADLAETLAVVGAGIGDVVLLDLDVRGLGREHLAELMRAAAVIGLRRPDSAATELGLARVLAPDASTAVLLESIRAAAGETLGSAGALALAPQDDVLAEAQGRMVTVWGPAGAPGRSTVAVNLAAEAALAGTPTVLVDADTYGPCLSQVLGVLEDSPGLVALCRAHDRGVLDAGTVASLLERVRPGLDLMTGIGVPARWAELREGALAGAWSALRAHGPLTVVDVAGVLEEDEELSYDTLAPQRNAAALSAVRASDAVFAVVTADPVSITRFLRQCERLRELGVEELHVIVNRVGPPVAGARIRELIAARAEVTTLHLLPDDPAACRTAAWEGASLCETAARSALRRGLRDIACSPALQGPGPSAAHAAQGPTGARPLAAALAAVRG